MEDDVADVNGNSSIRTINVQYMGCQFVIETHMQAHTTATEMPLQLAMGLKFAS